MTTTRQQYPYEVYATVEGNIFHYELRHRYANEKAALNAAHRIAKSGDYVGVWKYEHGGDDVHVANYAPLNDGTVEEELIEADHPMTAPDPKGQAMTTTTAPTGATILRNLASDAEKRLLAAAARIGNPVYSDTLTVVATSINARFGVTVESARGNLARAFPMEATR